MNTSMKRPIKPNMRSIALKDRNHIESAITISVATIARR